jgi:hypothetical protein
VAAGSAQQPTPARVAAWEALSELFLDTSHDDADIAAIARRLRATGLALSEIERIYEEEVAPACWRNLRAVPGGAWAGFDQAWLFDAVCREASAARPLHAWTPIRRWRIRRWTAWTREDWGRVRRLLG